MGGKLVGLPGSKGCDGSMRTSWWLVTSSVPQRLAVGSVLFKAFLNDIHDGLDHTL